jgi:hypothetical protein
MILIFLTVLSAWADPSSVLIKTELLVNGQTVSRPQMQVLTGERGEVQVYGQSKDLMRLKILAKPVNGKLDEIYLDMNMEYKSGSRTISSRPTVIAQSGSEAVMTLEESTPGEKIQLKVLATPVVR